MKNFSEIIYFIKEFKKLRFDKDVAVALRLNKKTFDTQKGRGTIPYEAIINFCIREGISPREVFYGEKESHDADNLTIRVDNNEERELVEKVLHVIRGKWQGEYEISLKQNINSFYHGTLSEKGIVKKNESAPLESDFKTLESQRGRGGRGT